MEEEEKGKGEKEGKKGGIENGPNGRQREKKFITHRGDVKGEKEWREKNKRQNKREEKKDKVCVCVWVWVGVSVCVCERERKKKGERYTGAREGKKGRRKERKRKIRIESSWKGRQIERRVG